MRGIEANSGFISEVITGKRCAYIAPIGIPVDSAGIVSLIMVLAAVVLIDITLIVRMVGRIAEIPGIFLSSVCQPK